MRSEKLFSILVIAGGALAANLPACNGSTPDPKDSGNNTTTDSGGNKPDTGTMMQDGGPKDTGTNQDTGVGAEFW